MTPALRNDALEPQHVLITGGAGYIGSLLTGVLLNRGDHVTVVDDLLFGGESLLGYWHHPNFRFIKDDVCDPEVLARLKSGEPQSRIRVPFGCCAFEVILHSEFGYPLGVPNLEDSTFHIPHSAFHNEPLSH